MLFRSDILRAIVGVIVFAGVATLGARSDVRWLAAGWALHVLWDGALHWTAPQVAPGWYASLCFGFDLAVAGGIVLLPLPGAAAADEPSEEIPAR